MNAMVVTDATKEHVLWTNKQYPKSFSDSDKQRITSDFVKLINEQLVPAYKKLGRFFKNMNICPKQELQPVLVHYRMAISIITFL